MGREKLLDWKEDVVPVSSLVGALPTTAEGEADELDMAAGGFGSFPASSS